MNGEELLAEAPARKLIKMRLKESCMDTSLMGVPRVLQESSHLFFRIFLALTFLGCSAAGIYFVIQGIQSYLSFSAYMSVNTYNEVPTKFPIVSFCSMNIINRSKLFSSLFIRFLLLW